MMDCWRPIADIPDEVRDEQCVLLYKPDESRSGEEYYVAYWGEWPGVEGRCWISVGGRPIAWTSMWTGEPVPQGVVTHWMPLPKPPLDYRPPLTDPEIAVFAVLDQVDAHASSEVSQGDVARRIVSALREEGYLRE